MTARFLLDTNAASHVSEQPDGNVARRMGNAFDHGCAINVIVAGEMLFGVYRKGSVALERRIRGFLERIPILPLDPEISQTYATIRVDLSRAGQLIGANDLWIAAHALAKGLIVVTDNFDEFSRVPGLRVENWLRESL